MDISIKVMLVASVILLGYNLSQVFASYDSVCKKIQDFKRLAQETESGDSSVKKSNFVLVTLLSMTYITIAYLCGFDYWILGILVFKFALSLMFSNMELNRILKKGSIDKGFYKISKLDELANALVGLTVALILVL
ncbi:MULTISPECIES: hypothetical protein [unclassified Fibrobacter]|uniref:hypothetical protein n=1 Tax=unclassified Fibrobacter TaxID=2634177 RepID=UPI000D6DC2A0|nr:MULTISPECIES: hypothetical protein [unclassified Fibrobacter]PWJ71850.1 hypothetical protein BGX12_10186 [Fibrobacter sp. UWR4]PZW73765.1 hypothetical protein C8E88_100286 [Fibrobacter sp. UWR1]